MFHAPCQLVLTVGGRSIRFAPPLVITEEELETAMRRIEACLDDFDRVGGIWCVMTTVTQRVFFLAARGDSGRGREREGVQGYARQLIPPNGELEQWMMIRVCLGST